MNSDNEELIKRLRNVQEEFMERIVPEKETYGNYQTHLARYKFASQFCKDKIVLDVASGVGYGSHYLIKNGAKKVFGVDISRDTIAYASIRYTNQKLEFIVGDAISLPFSDNFFDVIVSFETIEHVRGHEKFLSECKRVLKSSGIFICSSPNKMHEDNPNPYHFREFYLEEFYQMMKGFGDVKLYGQRYTTIITITTEKLLSVFPKGWKVKDLIKRIIRHKRYTIKKGDLSFSPDKTYQVSPFRKSSFLKPIYIISVAKKRAK